MKATAAEAEVALWDLQNESVNPNMSPWAFIPHEEKPGLFKFVWYAPSMQPEPGTDLPP
jgi:hypothetical protein